MVTDSSGGRVRPELSGRFLESTRGKVVLLLRHEPRTVDELARELGLTDNAIRSHLSTLERDGMVRQQGLRRGSGAGKPAVLYELPAAAAAMFSRAYGPVLIALLDELAQRLPSDRTVPVMHAVGRRLASALSDSRPSPGGDSAEGARDLAARVGAAVDVLVALGGDARVDLTADHATIRGCGDCPLGAAVVSHPDLCHAIESLLSEVAGVPVKSVCDHGERPRCGFDVRAVA
ncbi:MAG: helix-turn-helix transcriptional regulator [Gemmatimonadaceae bacterium]